MGTTGLASQPPWPVGLRYFHLSPPRLQWAPISTTSVPCLTTSKWTPPWHPIPFHMDPTVSRGLHLLPTILPPLPSPHVGFFHLHPYHHQSHASSYQYTRLPFPHLLPAGPAPRKPNHDINNGGLVYHKFLRKILSELVFLYSQIYPNLNLDCQLYLP